MKRAAGPWAATSNPDIRPGQSRLDEAYEAGWTPEQGDLEGPGPRGTWRRFYRVPSAKGLVKVDVLIGTDENGRLATYGIACDAPITSAMFDSLPNELLRRAAAEHTVASSPWVDLGTKPKGEKPLNLHRVRKADRHSDEFLQQIAAISRAALSRSHAVQAVMDECKVSSATAERYIRRAREAGHPITNQ